MSEHQNTSTIYQGSAMVHLIKYPHGSPTEEDCGCVECEHVYLQNLTIKPCKNPNCDHLTQQGNFGYCHNCTKSALDNAFKTLQTSLSIDPETGKHSDKITKAQIKQAKQKLTI